jgi:DNA-binding response OmpR family regulator
MGHVAKQILIVDDDGNDVALFRRILERAGYVVSGSESGKQAVRTIQEKAFDLVILDLNIPDMDGFEILRAIRCQIVQPRVLVVSGFMQGQLSAAARALGAAAVLDKSVAPDMLLVAVDSLLEYRRETIVT